MENILLDKLITPYEQFLEDKLGKTYQFYSEINKITDNYNKEWKFCGNKYGWKYKITDDKLLLELTAFENAFLIVIAIKENEWSELQNDKEKTSLLSSMKESGLKTESFGLKIIIRDENSFKISKELLEYVINKRNI